MIYSKDGWIYVEFPDSKYCCKCTDTFGSVRYDWIQENSTYVGRSTVDGVTVDQWSKLGNPALQMKNNYYVTVGDQKPVRFYETSGMRLKDIHYDLSTYSTGPLDPTLFDPPANCQTQCPGKCKTLNPKSNLQTE